MAQSSRGRHRPLSPLEAAAANRRGSVSQRWQDRRVRWVHPGGPRLEVDRYRVEEVGEPAARQFVIRHHYAGSMPAALKSYGLFDREEEERGGEGLVGVAVLSVPVSARTLTLPFPTLEPYRESCELGRLVLLDSVPFNGESRFASQVFRQAAASGIRGIVSFCDPVERRGVDGQVVMPGHIGVTYRALGARLSGRSAARSLVMLPDGTVFNGRSLQKVRSQERGHEYAERILVSFGARVRARRQDPRAWLSEALDAAGARRVRHPGNLRYLFPLGRTPRERDQVVLGLGAEPYPPRDEVWRAAL